MTHHDAPVTVGQLLALDLLTPIEVLGGQAALSRRVDYVVPGASGRAVAALPAASLAVFERDQLAVEDVAVDLAIRNGYSSQIAGIVAQRPERPIPMATRRLAEKLGFPVVLLDRVSVGDVVSRLEAYVRAPSILGADLLNAAVAALSAIPSDPEELLRRLSGVLRCPVALVDSEGYLIAGDGTACDAALVADLKGVIATDAARPGWTFSTSTSEPVIVQCAALTSAAAARNLWFVARPRSPISAVIVDACVQTLRVAAVLFTAYLAERSLEFERESRQRALLLTELLDQPDAPKRRAVERATALGWRLSGWHTAVHIAVRTPDPVDTPGGTLRLIEESLHENGMPASLVERPSGWAYWRTVEAEPNADDIGAMARDLRHALLTAERDRPHLRLCAGIGGSHLGTSGIGLSLQEAEHACLLARTHESAGAVEHVDTTSVRRLLTAWYASGPLGDIVTGLLTPLRASDPTGELVRTLRTYLDSESSATATAAILGVHRNTVINRLERIHHLLGANLMDPDERLAVHMAVRVAAP